MVNTLFISGDILTLDKRRPSFTAFSGEVSRNQSALDQHRCIFYCVFRFFFGQLLFPDCSTSFWFSFSFSFRFCGVIGPISLQLQVLVVSLVPILQLQPQVLVVSLSHYFSFRFSFSSVVSLVPSWFGIWLCGVLGPILVAVWLWWCPWSCPFGSASGNSFKSIGLIAEPAGQADYLIFPIN